MTTALSKFTLEEIETLMNQWQSIEDRPLTDEERDECVQALSQSEHSFEWWKAQLIRVPADVEDRYRKVIGMLLDKKLIDSAMHDYEVQVMSQFSPMVLVARGKMFAEWWRSVP